MNNIILCCILISLTACSTDYLSFSLDSSRPFGADKTQVYCNRFNVKGFNGIIVSYFDKTLNRLNENKARVFLWDVPHEFQYPLSNYIQIHSFYVRNNREEYNTAPVSMSLFNNKTLASESVITAISHNLLEDINQPIHTFIKTYSFILQDLEGWQGVAMSVFNSMDKPVKAVKVLIPPFPAHPDLFLQENNQERFLFQLHPFAQIARVNNNETAFYEKAGDMCDDSPIALDIFSTKDRPKDKEERDSVDQLLEDLSFITRTRS